MGHHRDAGYQNGPIDTFGFFVGPRHEVCSTDTRSSSAGPLKIPRNPRRALIGQVWSGLHLIQFAATNATFERCRFSGVRFDTASFGAGPRMSQYRDCEFDDASIDFAPGGRARFVDCSFRNVRLTNWIATTMELVGCTFSGTLRRAIFNARVPAQLGEELGRLENEFHDNDWRNMTLRDVTFRGGIDLARERLPVGEEYLYVPNAGAALALARRHLESNVDTFREDGLLLLTVLEAEVSRGQRQLFLCRDDYEGSLGSHVVTGVFELLRQTSIATAAEEG